MRQFAHDNLSSLRAAQILMLLKGGGITNNERRVQLKFELQMWKTYEFSPAVDCEHRSLVALQSKVNIPCDF